ncbi:unnamed protein product, partial [Musa banksii]
VRRQQERLPLLCWLWCTKARKECIAREVTLLKLLWYLNLMSLIQTTLQGENKCAKVFDELCDKW